MKRFLTLLIFSALLILKACGGGLGGSGDGGSNSSVLLPPELGANPLMFRAIPDKILVDLPDSLFDAPDSTTSSNSTLPDLKATVSSINTYKTETALLLLAAESSWQALQEHCDTTPINTACAFTTSQIDTTYTEEMASWEYIARHISIQESLGGTPISETEISDITNFVLSKVDSTQTLGNGTLTVFSTGSYQYELITNLDLGFGNNIYTFRWTEDRANSFLSIVSADAGNLSTMQVAKVNTGSSLNNSILISTYENSMREESQLNLKQTGNRDVLQIEAQLTQFGDDDKTDIYILGSAADAGGYIDSEHVVRNASDNLSTQFFRQGFDNNAELKSLAVCDDNLSTEECTVNNNWQVVSGPDPVTWQYYLSEDELVALETQLKPFDIEFQNVSLDMDSFILIRRENLTISLSSAGLIISVPGLGEFNLSGGLPDPDETANDISEDISRYTDLADSVLCRVNTTRQNGEVVYRSFCAGTVEEIENALVVGESFREGELKIEWQASAIIDVIGK